MLVIDGHNFVLVLVIVFGTIYVYLHHNCAIIYALIDKCHRFIRI